MFLSAEDDQEEDQIIERYSKIDESSLTASKNFKNSVQDSKTKSHLEKKPTVNSSRIISVDLFSEYLEKSTQKSNKENND